MVIPWYTDIVLNHYHMHVLWYYMHGKYSVKNKNVNKTKITGVGFRRKLWMLVYSMGYFFF